MSAQLPLATSRMLAERHEKLWLELTALRTQVAALPSAGQLLPYPTRCGSPPNR